MKNQTIAIVGGGPGGLALARLLQMCGQDVTVYERDFNRSYESEMQKRASEAAKESLENMEVMHARNAMPAILAMFGNR